MTISANLPIITSKFLVFGSNAAL